MKKYIKPYICTTVKASILDNISTTADFSNQFDNIYGEDTDYGAEETW